MLNCILLAGTLHFTDGLLKIPETEVAHLELAEMAEITLIVETNDGQVVYFDLPERWEESMLWQVLDECRAEAEARPGRLAPI